MISWIQTTFRRHFPVVFSVLLVLIIVSFVFTIGAAPAIGSGEAKRLRRDFFGANLGSQEEINRIMGDAELSVFLQAGYPAIGADQLQPFALQRHAGLHLANQLNIPAPTQAEITEHIQTLGAFAGQTGQFDAQRYADFRASLKTSPNLKEGDISRVIADDIRFTRVQRLLAGPGYVLPSEVRDQLIRADATWNIAVASAEYAAFAPSVTPTDADLTKFFEENAFRYELPPKVRLSYAEFPLSAHLGSVTVTDAEIRAFYDANPTRFPKPAEGIAAPAIGTGADADFLAVRGQVESALRAERALMVAAKAASDLSLALFEAKTSQAAVADFLAARGIKLNALAPFDESTVPPELGANPQVATEALKLNTARHFSDAIPTPAGAAVLFWQETLPARRPFFTEVAVRVGTDFVENEKRKRFVEVGRSVRDQLRARLKAGESFESAAAAVSGLSLTVKSHAGFTRRQPPADVDFAVLNALDSINQGEVSEMIGAADKGVFVFAAEKKLPDLTEGNPMYTTTQSQLAQAYASRAGNEYLFELVQKELAKTAPATP
jgi:peptidyl-prolyl cis-trans isomerase D